MAITSVTDLTSDLAAGAVDVVDLTQPLSETTPVLALPEPFANTPQLSRRRLSRFDDAGPAWAWDVLELGEHTGTHLDAPIHWITGRDGEDVAAIPPARLVGPAVVIDKTSEVADDPGYLLTAEDLTAFEAEHGTIAPGSWVLFRTGWGARAADAAAFLNAGPEGPVTPGPDADAARWLAEHPGVVGFGVETVGIDAGAAGGFEPGFPAHHHLLGNGRYGLTQLANLAALPATGALLVVAPLKLVGGTGSPSRVLALVPTG
ncbi:cyclase family protein [Conexibacter woesei]|uniref:Cyclase family protein n=1 Tax=Conexibacter woesei (strain DSM 14684 / CCUG 47730 / CIP 108061 / JCM 11494 / NBRC 100937 / ID131577) TaxID=469383 RepID=D3F5A5_CONWI|nr:cyclase family protein [Conexibacter woesei]ADB50572.1 cyclase family protein [Conexibacter woesei DSM 14684]